MNDVFVMFLSLSVSGSLIALFLWLLIPLIKKRISKTWRYYIYLAVILRLLIPLSPEHNLMNIVAWQGGSPVINSIEAAHPTEDVNLTLPSPQQEAQNEQPEYPESHAGDPTWTAVEIFPLIMRWLWLLWLGTALALFLRKLVVYHHFVRTAKAGCTKVEADGVNQLYQKVCETLGIRHPPGLVSNGSLAAPALLGVLRPVIALPDTELAQQQLRYVFHHELTHYRRLDIGYKWLVQVALCLHWYNPLVYFVSREINRCCELSCDEAVIKGLDETGKRAYGDMLLDAIRSSGTHPSGAVSITLSEDTKLVKERLTAIMKHKKSSKLSSAISALLAFAIVTGATFTGVYAAGNGTIQGEIEPIAPEAVDSVSVENKIPPISHIEVEPDSGYGSIVKTLSGDGIENIDIYAELCTLVLEKSATNNFEVQFSYPEITKSNYNKYFELNVSKKNGNAIAISTDYENQHGFDPISGFNDGEYPNVAVLTVKIPEKRYKSVRLRLSVVGSRPLAVGVNASTLNIHNNVGNLTVKTDRVYDHLSIDHYTGNVTLQLPALGKQLDVTSSIGVFTLSLPTDPTDVNLEIQSKDANTTSFDLPATWDAAIAGQTVRYRRGNRLHNIAVNNGQYSVFAVEIDGVTDRVPASALSSAGAGPSSVVGQSSSQVFKSFSDTKAAQRYIEQTEQRGDYFTTMRIDVQNSKGYDCQAVIFICEGSVTYSKDFLDALERLKAAYPVDYGSITGYMDLIRDNRLRNFGDSDYFAVEEVALTDAQGVSCTGYVIAACGSEQFEQPYSEFYDVMTERYELYKPKK